MLKAKEIIKSYGGQQILDQVSLVLDTGERMGVIGPNGSGKTTLVRLLSGEEQPDQGTIHFLGRPLSTFTRRELAQQIAVLPQGGLPPLPFTVQDIVMMGRYPHQKRWLPPTEEDRRIVSEVLEELQLTMYKDRSLDQLSGGERQRVAMAKVMAQKPKLLILDEPTTYLDIGYQVAILDIIQLWQQKQALSVLIVLHDLNLAAQYCDRLIIMKQGKVIQNGSPEEVLQPAILKDVYGIEPLLMQHPTAKVPQVLLQSGIDWVVG